MAVRTTIDIPEQLHEQLRQWAKQSGTSVRALIVKAIEQAYSKGKEGKYVTGPLVKVKGELGPAFPVDKNPHDLVLP